MATGIDEDKVETFFMHDLETTCSSFVKNDDELLACVHGFSSGALHITGNVENAIPDRSIDIVYNGLPDIQQKYGILEYLQHHKRYHNPELLKEIVKAGQKTLEEIE